MEVKHKVSYWLDKRRGMYRFKRTQHIVTYIKTHEELMDAVSQAEKEAERDEWSKNSRHPS